MADCYVILTLLCCINVFLWYMLKQIMFYFLFHFLVICYCTLARVCTGMLPVFNCLCLSYMVWCEFARVFWLYFGYFFAPLAPVCLQFGSHLDPCGHLWLALAPIWLPFGTLSVPLGSPLAPFRLPLDTLGVHFLLFGPFLLNFCHLATTVR